MNLNQEKNDIFNGFMVVRFLFRQTKMDKNTDCNVIHKPLQL